jgi:serine/threonine protein kinase/tetratricopeptide (TPR) repeat protein
MLPASTRLGPYEIVGPLGAGGMGEVYRARDPRLGREVAVKVLPEPFAQDPERRARFEREARAVAALSHPNILAIHDYGTHGAVTYAVMELLEGQTLRGRLAQGPLPWREAAEVGAAVADGLAAAHAKGIVHRDLKPENLFLTADGRVKILDFGLARVDREPTEQQETGPYPPAQTAPGTVMGTIGYMSPEQVRGLPVDARSDVFSLGCVLYEMLAGRRPFQRKTAADTTAAILCDEPGELAGFGIKVPPEVERVIRHCLEKDLERRFPSARDLTVTLRALLSGSNAPEPLAPTALYRGQRQRRPRKVVDSLAVLPLSNASADADLDYLSDGITESIIRTLSQLPELRVMARNTVFRFKGRDVDARAVGRELNVRAVLTGRVLQRGDRLILRAELVDTADGAQLWGEQYNRPLADLLALEEEMAREIVDGLRLRLSETQRRRLGKRPTVNTEAYQLYLRGRFYWNQLTEDAVKKAINCFRQALAKDSEYALAYAGLADCYTVLGAQDWPPKEAFPEAKKALKRAVKLNDRLAEVHVSLGWVLMCYDREWLTAEREFRLGLKLNPNLADAHRGYGWYCAVVGRLDEAIAALERAKELDPLAPASTLDLAFGCFYAGQSGRARVELRRTLEIDANFFFAYLYGGLFAALEGNYAEGLAALQSASSLAPDNSNTTAFLGLVQALAGNRTEAGVALERLHAYAGRRYVQPTLFALVHAALGEKDEAFRWLGKAEEDRAPSLIYLRSDPIFNNLRSDPRFQALLRKVGFPGASTASSRTHSTPAAVRSRRRGPPAGGDGPSGSC